MLPHAQLSTRRCYAHRYALVRYTLVATSAAQCVKAQCVKRRWFIRFIRATLLVYPYHTAESTESLQTV